MANKDILVLIFLSAINYYTAKREPPVDYIDDPWREGAGGCGSRGRPCFWRGEVFQDGDNWECNDAQEFDPNREQCNTCWCQNGQKGSTKIYCPTY